MTTAPPLATELRASDTVRATPGRKRRKKSPRRLLNYLYVAPAVLFVAATTLYPLYYNVSLSLYDASLKNFLQGTLEFVGLANYQEQLANPAVWNGLGVSLIYTISTIVLMFVLGLSLAVFFNRSFPGKHLLRAVLFLPYILPTVVSANIWRWILDGSYGLVNYVLMSVGILSEPVFWLGRTETALLSVILATAWTMAPFAMLLLLAGLQDIPKGLYEAATLDGSSKWQEFRHITLPLLRPVALVVGLLGFIYTFRTFDTIFIMTRGGPGDATTVLPVLAYNEGFVNFELGQGAAINTLLLVIPTVLALIYFRATKKE
ncbi:carbohydrate ABC transporter permease [Mycetocola miduiensis]|uniref:Carbohydrate ABC transporter membrane protein 1, CUT1 family n=1 Tax=Mycetocola miduiensis TaxID=995034 RepID=A0A1I5AIM3_9MICO|nr:sugar ABC transporter permease [Mycetocola miduiensis]SFN62297.1 carbohydrate ABC transporter membrane protein 1, CUT1 family [Mycetocola miduiensis]